MKINLTEFDRVEEKSCYNHNFYRAKHSSEDVLLEAICHEDENWMEYYVNEGDKRIFLGCCMASHAISEDEFEIDFGLMYT